MVSPDSAVLVEYKVIPVGGSPEDSPKRVIEEKDTGKCHFVIEIQPVQSFD